MTKVEKELIFKLYEIASKQENDQFNEHKIEAGNVKLKEKIIIEDESGKETWSAIAYKDGGTVFLLDKDYEINIKKFGENNNYNESIARKDSNDCAPSGRALKVIGKDAFLPLEIDLFSHDGFKDYGVCKGDLFGVMTFDMYRNNRENIDYSEMFLSTSDSTPSGYGSSCVQGVRSDGDVGCHGCDWDGGVRPFFILKSSIFVSLETE